MTGGQASTPDAGRIGDADAELLAFAAKGRITVFSPDDAMLRIGDMEQLYELRQHGERFELTRQQRSPAPMLLMSSTSLEAVRRFLLRVLGVTVRAELRLPRLALAFDPAALPDGFVLSNAVDADTVSGADTVSDLNGIELVWTERGEAMSARFRPGSAGERDAVQFAGYATASERTLIESLLEPSGRPLFATA
ncbi:Imm61 family immunity protein [Agromyces neolithicus]|uniref:Uncharacterized protein n=1 Tax=Agromyces neolithicus TaxID=269420 RepID=A0ABN2M757_9MICO